MDVRRPQAAGTGQEESWSRHVCAPKHPAGLKPKDLIGIPWRLALALQEPYPSYRTCRLAS